MKLTELISNISVYLTNEEKNFVKKYSSVKLSALDEHNHWLAQNLVRKGVYEISNDCNTITKCK